MLHNNFLHALRTTLVLIALLAAVRVAAQANPAWNLMTTCTVVYREPRATDPPGLINNLNYTREFPTPLLLSANDQGDLHLEKMLVLPFRPRIYSHAHWAYANRPWISRHEHLETTTSAHLEGDLYRQLLALFSSAETRAAERQLKAAPDDEKFSRQDYGSRHDDLPYRLRELAHRLIKNSWTLNLQQPDQSVVVKKFHLFNPEIPFDVDEEVLLNLVRRQMDQHQQDVFRCTDGLTSHTWLCAMPTLKLSPEICPVQISAGNHTIFMMSDRALYALDAGQIRLREIPLPFGRDANCGFAANNSSIYAYSYLPRHDSVFQLWSISKHQLQ